MNTPRWFLLLILIPASTLALAGENPSSSDTAFTPADNVAFVNLFSLGLDRETRQPKLIAVFPSTYGMEADNPFRPLFERQFALFEAHYRLMEKDSAYKQTFTEAEKLLITQLGLRSSERVGRQATYFLLLEKGIYQRILGEAGLADVRLPEDYLDDPAALWGREDEPFLAGGDPPGDFPSSVVPFHYCSGGITISGGEAEPHVRTHNSLMKTDPDYRSLFNTTVAPFVEQAEKLDPFDIEGGWKITEELRQALIKSGIAARLKNEGEAADSHDKRR